MTETEQKIINELAALRSEVAQIQVCLTGDRMKNVMGVIDILETHRRELYGNDSTRDIGLKEKQALDHRRITELQGDRMKVIYISAGVSGTIMGVWSLVKFFLIK